MDAKRHHIAALLLCTLAPAVAAASAPPRAELQKTWNACTAVAANSGHGRLSTDATDWPRGFKGCAVVVSDMDAREAAEAKHAWAQWVTKHAADQALIRKVAGQTQLTQDINWRQFKRQCATAAKRAAQR